MKKLICLILLSLIVKFEAQAKLDYTGKIEFGYMKFRYWTVKFSEGPEKGYNLNNKQNGIDINLVNSLNFRNRVFTGIGIGYMNFERISGVSAFTDIEFLILKTRLTPLVNLRVGYNHIFNQYENGKGTGSGELAAGLSFRFAGKFRVYAQVGGLTTQQAYFVSMRAGFCLNIFDKHGRKSVSSAPKVSDEQQ